MKGQEFKHDPNEKWVDPYPTRKRKIGWFTGTFILLAIYVLSTGPLIVMARKGHLRPTAISTIYAPLDVLCDASPPIEKFMRWYIRGVWKAPATRMTHSGLF